MDNIYKKKKEEEKNSTYSRDKKREKDNVRLNQRRPPRRERVVIHFYKVIIRGKIEPVPTVPESHQTRCNR